MEILCEINLNKPADGVYTPGSPVSGKIKYCLEEETVFSKITVSLKGQGRLAYKDYFRKRNYLWNACRNSEHYVDITTVIQNNGLPLPAGTYETQFNYKLPNDIPDSIKFSKRDRFYMVWCQIAYHIIINFEKPGKMRFNKQYKKKITVGNTNKTVQAAAPRHPTALTLYTEQILTQIRTLFSKNKNIVSIKATIPNPVVKAGENVKVEYEVGNNTNLTLNAVKIQLVQINTIKPKINQDVRITSDVKDTGINHGPQKSGETTVFSDKISIPADFASLDHSQIISMGYAVSVTAVIPRPYRNLVLEIPLQVIGKLDSTFEKQGGSKVPPSCWEVMRYVKKSKLYIMDSSDEENKKP